MIKISYGCKETQAIKKLINLSVFIPGMNPQDVRGSRTGVFIGVSASESDEFWTQDPEQVNGYGLTGCCRAMFPNRISFTFDFQGKQQLRSISLVVGL